MRIFQRLLLTPAMLGILAPVAVAETNVPEVSKRAATSEQVTSVFQFSDIYPTDWAYQALSSLVEQYGCVAGYPNRAFRGNRAMTRFEAAALLNACLNRVGEVTDGVRRLTKEFEAELAVLGGRADGLEARIGELEATRFSTTTKLRGKTSFVIGSNTFSGNASISKQFSSSGKDTIPSSTETTKKMADVARENLGAVTFNYDQRLTLDTSFTGKDLLRTRFRTGNFGDSAFGFSTTTGIPSPFEGNYSAFSGLETASEEDDIFRIDRLFYQFPLGSELTLIVGGLVRQDDMLPTWPSMYPYEPILDYFTYAGAPGTYNLNIGPGAGIWWKKGGFSIAANYISNDGNFSSPAIGSFINNTSNSTRTVQLAYSNQGWAVSAAYNYSSKEFGNMYESTSTPLATRIGSLGDTNSIGLSAYWQPNRTGWAPSVNFGWGLNNTSGDSSSKLLGYKFNSATTQSWYAGLQWRDVLAEGNSAGVAVGQQGFVTSIDLAGTGDGPDKAHKVEDVLARDGQYSWEIWYQLRAADNVYVTPALFYLSRPLGAATQGFTFDQIGALSQSNVRFLTVGTGMSAVLALPLWPEFGPESILLRGFGPKSASLVSKPGRIL
ncbi:porin [cyanobiont of Ornithocercus magnificus]|nr:porin [cyanobiont of Ornithocercus magnificus]